MYIRYSTGFLVASIVQAITIMLSERFQISSLGAKKDRGTGTLSLNVELNLRINQRVGITVAAYATFEIGSDEMKMWKK